MYRVVVSWVVAIAMMSCVTASMADGLPGSIFAIERYNTIKRSYITEPYDIFCLQRPGFMVDIPWDAIQIYGDQSRGQVEVELINMGMIECKHGWDLHEMGSVRQGSGGTEWAAVYNDEFLVRFTAMEAEITHSNRGEPSIRALVHPMYCDKALEKCIVNMRLPSY